MTEAAAELDHSTGPIRTWAAVFGLVAMATLLAKVLDNEVSLTSQAMLYLAAVVVASYRLERLAAIVCAIASVISFNFFFVPPRGTLSVEHHEHFIALATMLGVALVVNYLASALRHESAAAQVSETRAVQLQRLSRDLLDAPGDGAVREVALRELRRALGARCLIALRHELDAEHLVGIDDRTRDGLRCAIREAAIIGPGTARWPGLDAWFLPLGHQGHILGAACVIPAPAHDADARDHAQALCSLAAQALWRLQLAADVQAAQAEVERHAVQRTLLAAVSHDLRTPLAAIVGAASSLKSQQDRLSEAEKLRLLSSIENEAAYLSTVTDNTLQLVRLSGESLQLRRDWESMEEIVGSVLARVRERDPSRRIKSRVPRELPLVKVDPVLIAQLLGNLLDNALKYSDGPVDLTVSLDNQHLVVAVKDRGPGMPAGTADRLFEPFVRGEAGSHQRGAGLGLAVCLAIARAHDGELGVQRRSGGGSSFRLRLPVDANQPSEMNP